MKRRSNRYAQVFWEPQDIRDYLQESKSGDFTLQECEAWLSEHHVKIANAMLDAGEDAIVAAMEAGLPEPGRVSFELPLPVTVQLVGQSGDSLAIVHRVSQAMRSYGASKELRDDYMKEALSGDYSNLLAVTEKYVEVT